MSPCQVRFRRNVDVFSAFAHEDVARFFPLSRPFHNKLMRLCVIASRCLCVIESYLKPRMFGRNMFASFTFGTAVCFTRLAPPPSIALGLGVQGVRGKCKEHSAKTSDLPFFRPFASGAHLLRQDYQNDALIAIYFSSSLSPTRNPMGRRLICCPVLRSQFVTLSGRPWHRK